MEVILMPVTALQSSLIGFSKLKLKKSITIGSLLMTVNGKEIKSPCSGKIIDLYQKSEDEEIIQGTLLVKIEICQHPAIYSGLCVSCGERPETEITTTTHNTSMTVAGGRTIKMSKAELSMSGNNKRSGLQGAKKLALILYYAIHL